MFDPKTGLEVLVRPFASEDPYQEYKSESCSYVPANSGNECYIEAITEERFAVKVIVHPVFNFKGCSDLHVRYGIDGGTIRSYGYIRKPTGEGRNRSTLSDEASCFIDCANGVWRKYGFRFREVKTSKQLLDDPLVLQAHKA